MIRMNYYYKEQANQFNFIRIPKQLVTGEEYSSLSLYSKMLYGILLDRMSVSVKNKWIDEENKVYVIYPVEDIQEVMHLSKHKVIECLTELEEKNLILKYKIGKGYPNRIYLRNFTKLQTTVGF